ncbi:MAG: TIGR03564 family F420-dependent LLM class oxidoreductase [Acidimicrobiales bacterium]
MARHRIGMQLRAPLRREGDLLSDLVDSAREIEEAGLDSLYLTQAFAFDALTALAVIGQAAVGLELGTAVVPTYPRHPVALAEQALTVQLACQGRLVLGVGPSHREMMERVYGVSFTGVAAHVEEYLTALNAAMDPGRSPLAVDGASRCPVLLGALGPAMLRIAGTIADGTITARAGPRTLGTHIVPKITEAARAAGRPAPRVAACVPFCVTRDVEQARARTNAEYAGSAGYPSYVRMLEIEGVEQTADVSIIGDEATCARQIQSLFDLGVTDFLARPIGTDTEIRRGLALLGALI